MFQPLPTTVYAGSVPPSEIVAVVRPASFNSASASKNLDQKHIVISKEDLEMCMQIKLRAADKSIKDIRLIYSRCIKPSPRKGFQGLYIFPVGRKLPGLFEKAGDYTFSFSLVSHLLEFIRNSSSFIALSYENSCYLCFTNAYVSIMEYSLLERVEYWEL